MWRLKMPCRALAFLHRWRILALPHTSALMTKSIYTSKETIIDPTERLRSVFYRID